MAAYNPIQYTEAKKAYIKFVNSTKGLFGLTKKTGELRSFTNDQKSNNAYNSSDIGIKNVELDKIVGSVEKYYDFDKNFVPKNTVVKDRWINIYLALMNEEPLPPVVLYKIKDRYYVYDGNHRISVAKYLNFAEIEAEVLEYLPSGEDVTDIIYREKFLFEKDTGIEKIIFTDPGKYKVLYKEIEEYQKHYLDKKDIDLDLKEASKKWYDEIFLPITKIIESNDIIKNLALKNINDAFTFVLDHKYFISEHKHTPKGYLFATVDFINLVKTNQDIALDNKCEIKPETLKYYDTLLNYDKESELPKETVLKNEILKEETGVNFKFGTFTFERIDIFQQNNDIKDYREAVKKWYIDNYIHMLNYLVIKIKKLPEKYSKYFKDITEDEKQIFHSIHRYRRIHYYYLEKDVLTVDQWKSSVLNYIIEIYVNIVDGIIADKIPQNKVRHFYYKIENEYMYVLQHERELTKKKFETTYNKVRELDTNITLKWFRNRFGVSDISEILVHERYDEYLSKIQNSDKFNSLVLNYGGIKNYKTYSKTSELMNLLGEENFINKSEKNLETLSSKELIVREYKTLSLLHDLDDEHESISFYDFYIMILYKYRDLYNDIDFINIIDLALDFLS